MGRPRMFQQSEWQLFELTIRCFQGRLLLTPGDEANRIIAGTFGRSLFLYGKHVRLHFVYGTSTHLHLLVSTRSAYWKGRFKSHLKTNISKKLGTHRMWVECLWSRRSRDIAVLDDEAALRRCIYGAAHGIKEGLCLTPGSWPGVQWLKALTHGEPLKGVWHDMTTLSRLKRRWTCAPKATRGAEPTKHDVAIVYNIELTPMQMWAHLSEADRHTKWVEVAELAAKTFPNPHAQPMTKAEVLAQDPQFRPAHVKRSQAPAVHTTKPELRDAWRKAYADFCERWAKAAARVARGLAATFPIEGCHPLWLPAREEEPVSATPG